MNSSAGCFKKFFDPGFLGLPQKNLCNKINFYQDTAEAISLLPCHQQSYIFNDLSHLFCFPIQLEIKLFNSTDEDDFLSPVITQEFFSPGKIIPFISVFG